MSEFLLILVWLAIGAIVYGTVQTKEYVIVQGEKNARNMVLGNLSFCTGNIYGGG